MTSRKLSYLCRRKISRNGLDMFIKNYIIMNYETTKYGDPKGRADQQGGESAKEITIKSKSDRVFAGRIRHLSPTSVSVCARSWQIWEDNGLARGERSGGRTIAGKYDQASADVKEEKEGQYRRDYNRSSGDLFERKWDLKRIPDKWRSSMSLTG